MSVLVEKIEAATNDMLLEPDWAKNMEICDLVSRDPSLAYTTIKTLRARLKSKNAKVSILALSLVEALIKNCPKIHPQVADRDFMNQLVKMVKKKGHSKSRFKLGNNDGGTFEENEKIDKTLILIQLLGQEFSNSASFPIFRQTYQDLVREGVRFPAPLKDEGAPIFTPPAQAVKPKPVAPRPDLNVTQEAIGDPALAGGQEAAILLFEMLDNSSPEAELKNDETINMLIGNVRSQQAICIRALQTPMSEDKIADHLAANDVMLQGISYYDGLISGTMGRKGDEEQEESEEESESEEEKEEDADALDILGLELDLNRSKPKRSQKKKPVEKKKPKKTKKDKHKLIPKLAPPKDTKKAPGSNRGRKKQQDTNVIDILDLDQLGPTSGGTEDDFFSSFPEPQMSPATSPKRGRVAKTEDDEDDFDEFFEIASRHMKPEKQSSTKIENSLPPTNHNANQAADPFDPLY